MKKLVLLLAVVFSVSLFSCGNKANSEAAADSTAIDTAVVVETVSVSDTVVADSVAAPVDTVANK